MKKLLVIAPLSIMLAACSTVSDMNPFKANKTAVVMENTHSTSKAYDRSAAQRFTCADGATVGAKYSVDGEEVMIHANLPKANWMDQTIDMTIAPSGSGSRYVNTVASNNVNYTWHAKADSGFLSLNWVDGQEYSVECQRVA